MRPVNLIPEEIRRRQGSDDTAAPYVVVAVLAVSVVALGGYVISANQVTSKKNQLQGIETELKTVARQQAELAPYGRFAALRQTRTLGVSTIAAARFPWAEVLLDVSKALPENTWLVEATGKVSPQAKTGEKSDGQSSTSKSQKKNELEVPGPTLKLTGCTYRATDVARMMTRLRNTIDGVAQVLLTKDEKKDEQDKLTGPLKGSKTECRTKRNIRKFVVTITFPPAPATQLVNGVMAAAAASAAAKPTSNEKTGEAGGESSPSEGASKP